MIHPVPKPMPKFKEKRGRSSLPAKRKEPRRSGRERDPVYLAKVRQLSCVMGKAALTLCEGRTEADHVGPRPLGRKCHDHEAVPMCQRHHWERTNYVGAFKNFTATEMRAACDHFIAKTRQRLGWTLRKDAP